MIKKIFKTNGPGLIEAVKSSWSLGKFSYFFHNLSCELRRGRYDSCYGYTNTWYDRVLFSLGVFIMDPLGTFYYRSLKHRLFYSPYDDMTCKQWERHPMPWVSYKAKQVNKLRKRDAT